MKTLSGKEPAERILEDARQRVAKMARKPGLAIVLVGNEAASEIYVKKKLEKAAAVGVEAQLERLPADASEADVLKIVKKLNNDKKIDGFIVQAPLPKSVDYTKIVEAIDPAKDIDGWTSANLGKMFNGLGKPLLPATPLGVIRMLEYYGVEVAGKHAVVIGRSNVVGKPVAILLLERNATVTICHSKTKNLSEHTKKADIIIAAAGVPGLVKADMVREGAYIIDVGTTSVNGKIKGDVDFDNVIKKASCSPVPGGVGPMTVAVLISNVVEAAERR